MWIYNIVTTSRLQLMNGLCLSDRSTPWGEESPHGLHKFLDRTYIFPNFFNITNASAANLSFVTSAAAIPQNQAMRQLLEQNALRRLLRNVFGIAFRCRVLLKCFPLYVAFFFHLYGIFSLIGVKSPASLCAGHTMADSVMHFNKHIWDVPQKQLMEIPLSSLIFKKKTPHSYIYPHPKNHITSVSTLALKSMIPHKIKCGTI